MEKPPEGIRFVLALPLRYCVTVKIPGFQALPSGETLHSAHRRCALHVMGPPLVRPQHYDWIHARRFSRRQVAREKRSHRKQECSGTKRERVGGSNIK